MKQSYNIKYRQPRQFFWRTIKDVVGDGVEQHFRWFQTEQDELIYISNEAEVIFPPERQKLITEKMSKEVGQPVQRA